MVERESQDALEKIVKDGYALLVNNQVAEEKDISVKTSAWVGDYIAPTFGEKQAKSTYDVLRRDPLIISQMISTAQKLHTDNLVSEVKTHPYSVVESLSDDYLTEMASKFFGKNYAEIEGAIQQEGDVRGVYSRIFGEDNVLWKSLVAIATPEAIIGAAKAYVEGERREETIKNLYNEDGKFDKEKSQKYVADNILKENKDPLYAELGMIYTKTVLERTQSKK